MQLIIKYSLVLIAFFYCQLICAQDYSYIQYNTTNGLAGSNVYRIIQDSQGFIWVSTETGVSKFDGNTFENFTIDNGLLEKEIFYMIADKERRIWFIPFGEYLSYYKDGAIENKRTKSSLNKRIQLNSICSHYNARDSTLFLGGDLLLRLKHDTVAQYSCGHLKLRIHGFFERKEKFYLFGGTGIYEFRNHKIEQLSSIKTNASFRGACKAGQTIFFYDNHAIYDYQLLDNLSLKFIHRQQFPYTINQVKNEGDKYLWILTQGFGALRINLQTKDTTRLLPNKYLSDVFIDKENNYWFSTFSEGIYLLHNTEINYYNKLSGLSTNGTISITGDANGRIWAGFINGKVHGINSKRMYDMSTKGIGYLRIMDLTSKNNHTYVATDKGALKLLPNGNMIRLTDSGAYKSIRIAPSGNIVTGDASYGRICSPDLKILHQLEKRVTSVCAVNDSMYLFGSLNGITQFKENKFSPFYEHLQLLKDRVTDMIYQDGVYYLGTYNNGLIVLQNDSFIQVQCLPEAISKTIKRILPDKNGVVWFATTNHIYKLQIDHIAQKKYRIQNISFIKKLPSIEISSIYKQNDTMWVATTDGVYSFSTRNLDAPSDLEVYIKNIQVQNKMFHPTQTIVLNHDDNLVKINFGSISFLNTIPISFRYKLEGVDKTWSVTGERSIEYVGLSPGKYSFQVSAFQTGKDEGKIAVINFEIKKPFWETWIFYVLSLLLASGIIYLVYRSRVSNIKKHAAIENKLLESEIKALRAQINPHFIFNSLNSIQNYIFNHQKEEANEYLSKFSALIRSILDLSQKNFNTLDNEIRFLGEYLYLEKLRYNNAFDYNVEIDKIIDTGNLRIPPMIIQPFIENALIHGFQAPQNGLLQLLFTQDANRLYCRIIDNGVGIEQAKKMATSYLNKHKSFGITATFNRIESINKAYHIDITCRIIDLQKHHHSQTGTEVTLSLPLLYNH